MIENKYDISILVVEDEMIISLVYKKILENLVYNYDIISNAEAALEKFSNNKYDMIISDIMLPGMDGLEFIQKIRSIDKNIQVVFASAMDNTETLTRAISLGVSQYLIKPINKNKLVEVINYCYPIIATRRELVLAQLALENANKNLSQKVLERTEDLQIINKQLIQEIEERRLIEKDLIKAKEEAESANSAKDSFLANVSHELRTPLNGIIGLLHLLNKTEINEKQKEYLNYLKYSSELLLSIINDILNFAKLAAGKIILEKTFFVFQEMIDEIIPIFNMLAQQKNLQFENSYDKAIPILLKGDKLRIKQILNNILSNSIKFTGKGKVKIKTELVQRNKNEVEVLMTITDTGIGIPDDVKEQIFTPFIQADGSYTRKYGGTGLGLSIAKEFVKLHDGTIWFESKENEGSVFYINIPFEFSEVVFEDVPKVMLKADNEIKAFSSSQKLKILIIEDNEINSHIIQEFLSGNDFIVFVAENGSIGLDLYAEKKPDIIITDIQMPVMNGLEFAKHVIKYEKELNITHIPIIAITAHASDEDKNSILAYGIDDFIAKPIDYDILIEMIHVYFLKNHNIVNNNINDIADITSLSKAVFGKKESITKYINAVLEIFPCELEKMEIKINEKNIIELKRLAHKTKSSIANFNAKKLFNSLEKLYNIDEFTDNKIIYDYLKETEFNFNEFKTRLEQIKKELKDESFSC